MAKNDFQYGGWNSYTLQCGTITTLISSGDCTLQCGMWLWSRDSEFSKWQHPAMWYVPLEWHAIEFAQTSAILHLHIASGLHFHTSPQSTCSGGAMGGAAGARAPAVKPCAPDVPRQLSYSDVDHKRINWLKARHYFEDVNYDAIAIIITLNPADIRLMFSTRSSAVAASPHVPRVIEYFAKSLKVIGSDTFE